MNKQAQGIKATFVVSLNKFILIYILVALGGSMTPCSVLLLQHDHPSEEAEASIEVSWFHIAREYGHLGLEVNHIKVNIASYNSNLIL